MPKGWVSVGFPYDDIAKTKPTFAEYTKHYTEAYHEPAKTYSVMGYNAIKAVAAVITKAGSTDPEKIKAAFDNLKFNTAYGEETLRAIDHQATVPYWIGVSDVVDGKPRLSDWKELNVGDYSPPDEVITKLREGK